MSTRFFGNPFENFFAIGARALGRTLASAATAPSAARISTSATGPATTAAAHSAARSLAFFAVRIREIDGVDDGVGALGGLDRALQVSLAAAVDAVRENDESLPALLIFH